MPFNDENVLYYVQVEVLLHTFSVSRNVKLKMNESHFWMTLKHLDLDLSYQEEGRRSQGTVQEEKITRHRQTSDVSPSLYRHSIRRRLFIKSNNLELCVPIYLYQAFFFLLEEQELSLLKVFPLVQVQVETSIQ